MASCDAADVQLRAFSPPFRRARETRTESIDPRHCKGEKNNVPCPDGWCRHSGVLRKQTVTRAHPWGSKDSTPPEDKTPTWTEADRARELASAIARRKAFREAILPKLQAVLDVANAHELALAADEQERIRELAEWRDLLAAEK